MNMDPEMSLEGETAEFTMRAVLLGVVLAVVLGAANTYLGLYAGMTVSASIPAAVISMGILRGILRRGTILENNMVQTIASTGESLAAGIIFTMPALVIVGVWSDFDYATVTMVALFGGILGIIFMIPLRRSLIIEEKTLKYPEGTACAEVLKAGEEYGSGMIEILLGIIVGSVLKLFISGIALFRGVLEIAGRFSGSVFYFGSDVSAALVGVGAIVGFNIALLMIVGGALGWLVGVPILGFFEAPAGDALASVWELWSTKIRYMGVGAMVVAGIWSIVKIRHGIFSGFREVLGAYDRGSEKILPRTGQNMSGKTIILIISLVTVGMLAFYYLKLGSVSLTVVSVVAVLVLSVFLVAVASYICGLVGSSNSPVSGMTICALLITALILYLLGARGSFAILSTLLVAGVICCATCTAGDISQDLKTGVLVGATPRKQQWGEILGAVVPAFFFGPILALLHNAYGIGTGAPGSLKAPQAALFAGLTKAIFGDSEMPWLMLIIGIVIAVIIVLADEVLARKKSQLRLYPMPVAVGIYLPFSLSVPILAGGIIELAIRRRMARKPDAGGSGQRRVVLLSSGLIAGEALMGILVAIGISLIGYYRWGIEIPLPLPVSGSMMTILTLFAGFGVVALLAVKGLRHRGKQQNR